MNLYTILLLNACPFCSQAVPYAYLSNFSWPFLIVIKVQSHKNIKTPLCGWTNCSKAQNTERAWASESDLSPKPSSDPEQITFLSFHFLKYKVE